MRTGSVQCLTDNGIASTAVTTIHIHVHSFGSDAHCPKFRSTHRGESFGQHFWAIISHLRILEIWLYVTKQQKKDCKLKFSQKAQKRDAVAKIQMRAIKAPSFEAQIISTDNSYFILPVSSLYLSYLFIVITI